MSPTRVNNGYTTVLRRLDNDVKRVLNPNEEAVEEMELRFAKEMDVSSDDD